MKKYKVILTESEMRKLNEVRSYDDDDDEFITVDHISRNNYKKYVGKKVNVRDYVDLSDLNLREIPITFGTVGGDFFCYNNSLISLNGSPTEVAGDFDCCNNKLTSLNGCPREVVGDFSCYANKKKFAKYDVKRLCTVIGNIYNI